MVLSSHFDAGCKVSSSAAPLRTNPQPRHLPPACLRPSAGRCAQTPGCTQPQHLTPGEPRVCAKVTPRWPKICAHDPANCQRGEPWAYHIVNRYFDEFLPRAIALAEEGRRNGTAYSYMTQPWVASLYLDCEGAGWRSWPGSG